MGQKNIAAEDALSVSDYLFAAQDIIGTTRAQTMVGFELIDRRRGVRAIEMEKR